MSHKTLEQMAEEAFGRDFTRLFPENLRRFAALVANRCAEIAADAPDGGKCYVPQLIRAEFPKP